MSKIRTWIPVSITMPHIMEDVLICDKNNEIYKGFQNLNNIWIIQNTNSITAWRYNDESSVIAWMKLPNVYKKYSKEGWIRTDKALPDTHTPILISTNDAVYISYVRNENSDMWWLRNKNKDGADSVYLFKYNVIAWMPLPDTFKTTTQ